MSETKEVSVIEQNQAPATLQEVVDQVKFIQEIMKNVMKEGEHYGLIPGCGDKPALLKSGAEKLGFVFRLRPIFNIDAMDFAEGHREYRITCKLSNGTEGVGSCSTLESKYRYRDASRKCPNCGKEAIIKGKEEYGGGWLCFAKKGGCGSKWPVGATEIEGQTVGKVEYENPADYYNTCLKMAKKRAHVDAILTATAASDIFAQDIEEMADLIAPAPTPQAPKETTPKPETEATQKASDSEAAHLTDKMLDLAIPMCNGDFKKAERMILDASAFPGKKGNMVVAKDFKHLSGSEKWLYATFDKVQKMYQAWYKNENEALKAKEESVPF